MANEYLGAAGIKVMWEKIKALVKTAQEKAEAAASEFADFLGEWTDQLRYLDSQLARHTDAIHDGLEYLADLEEFDYDSVDGESDGTVALPTLAGTNVALGAAFKVTKTGKYLKASATTAEGKWIVCIQAHTCKGDKRTLTNTYWAIVGDGTQEDVTDITAQMIYKALTE